MYVLESSWSLGVLIGVPVAALVLLIALAAAAGGILMRGDGGWGLFAGAVAVILVVLGVCAWAYYPYHGEYHQWRTHSGTVADVSNRLISAGDKGGSNQKFVVRFEGSGQQYGCNDTRCASVKVGDDLTISCKRAWQYSGTDGYDCNFVSLESAK